MKYLINLGISSRLYIYTHLLHPISRTGFDNTESTNFKLSRNTYLVKTYKIVDSMRGGKGDLS